MHLDLEPADIQSTIFNRAQTLLETSNDPELYYCSVMNSLPENRKKILRSLEEKYTTENDEIRKFVIFNTLRLLRFPHAHNIYDMYWKQVRNQLSDPDQYENYTSKQLSWVCHRYCYFSESLGCSYRYLPFEATASKLAIEELKSGLGGLIPTKTFKLIAFLIAYGHYHNAAPPNKILPEFLLAKLEELSDQLTIQACRQVARGLNIFLRLNQHIQLRI